MKKWTLAILLTATMCFFIAACGEDDGLPVNGLPVIYINGNTYSITIEEGIVGLSDRQDGIFFLGDINGVDSSDDGFYSFDGDFCFHSYSSNHSVYSDYTNEAFEIEAAKNWEHENYFFCINGHPELMTIDPSLTLNFDLRDIGIPFSVNEDSNTMDEIWECYENSRMVIGESYDQELLYESSRQIIDYFESKGYHRGNYDGDRLIAFYTETDLFDYEDPDFVNSDEYHRYCELEYNRIIERDESSGAELSEAYYQYWKDYFLKMAAEEYLFNNEDFYMLVIIDIPYYVSYIESGGSINDDNVSFSGEEFSSTIDVYSSSPELFVGWANSWCPDGLLADAVEEEIEQWQIED